MSIPVIPGSIGRSVCGNESVVSEENERDRVASEEESVRLAIAAGLGQFGGVLNRESIAERGKRECPMVPLWGFGQCEKSAEDSDRLQGRPNGECWPELHGGFAV